MDISIFLTNWIWTPDWTVEDDADVRIVCFRKEFTVEPDKMPERKTIRISADSRYKLYMNGAFVQEGPQKALSLKEWYVDTAELAPYLQQGVNVAAVEVLRYPASNFSNSDAKTNDSLLRTEIPNLYIEDLTEDAGQLSGKTGWKCKINREIRVYGEDERPAPIHVQEDVHATDAFAGWKKAGYDDSDWSDATPRMFFDISMSDAPGCLIPRTIPAQHHEEKQFLEAVCLRDPAMQEMEIIPLLEQAETELYAWNELVQDKRAVTIPAGTTVIVELSAGELVCGYLEYALRGGRGANIATLCSECYATPGKPDPSAGFMGMQPKPVKGDRTDYRKGKLFGHVSHYTVAGYGSEAQPEEYEPYWFRTFRYVQLRIETADEPLEILRFSYRATGYPLEVKTNVSASDPDFAGIWDISVRTLRRCMHETYMDCPFYEQLQYAMDGRSEILYTYAISADDRLSRQAMEAFRLSQRPDGLVNCDAPTVKSNVIPGFSIYYLLMVHDHMMYFGDRELVKEHLPAIDRILAFFDGHINELGMVGKIGGPIMRDKYWSFIDWSTLWGATGGVPTACQKGCGSITIESLLYLYGLQHASELAAFVGRAGLAEEYRERAGLLRTAIQKNCLGSYKGQPMIQDGPGVDEYSVHTQVFAILTGTVTPEEGKAMLQATVGNAELPQASVAFAFYLFRALEKCSWYEKTDELWNLWRQMLRDQMTTCVENDTDARSDCHAWASLMCYELPAVILGVRPTSPGFATVSLAPQMGALTQACAEVITPKGMIQVEWKKEADGNCQLHYTLPEGIRKSE
ncbi:MAG: hypothetical protein IJ744_05420 [Lachnospiraceae bacterium]|nr:hypothetical protein [Lachnospiraceae bacterium]